MHQPPDILSIAYRQPLMHDELEILEEREQQIPGSVQYMMRRYSRNIHREFEEAGMLIYHFQTQKPKENYLELRFCIAGNTYCNHKPEDGERCRMNSGRTIKEKCESVDVLSFKFSTVHLSQFLKPLRAQDTLAHDILHFQHKSSFTKILPLCGRTRILLESLLNHNYTESLQNIFINAQTQMLLLYSLECMVGEKDVESFSCKFLANEADRDKIARAREILIDQIGEPITIKELSRKVAMNECYLKKGFKELFGTTIFDFYQSQRMEHARYLLYEKGLSVTDVSMLLGYSSISHFSTAFKKHTGLKPCELLFH
ncbi:MAG: AraC family transcriptional regulator [Chitinophagaceae bacterium]